MGDLGVGVLGPLRVVRAGEPVELGSRRERAVLVRLALEAGSAVSVERLIEELWGGAAAAGGRGSLQSYVSRLRRVLDPERRGLIELAGGGYRLVVEADVVDALRFERLVGEASGALAASDFERASGLFAEALSLWRGGALADFAYEDWAQGWVARLEGMRLAAVEGQMEAALALGWDSALVPELEGLVAAHPLRERFRAQLALALYRCGRQAEALDRLRDGRRALDELGIEPSPELRALEVQILNQDPALASAVRLAPRVAVAAGSAPPGGVDAGGVVLVGRERELGLLERALTEAAAGRGRVVLVEGEPGIGKSRLAVEVAQRAAGVGGLTLWGACYEGEGAPSLWPWLAIVREAATLAGAGPLAELGDLDGLLGPGAGAVRGSGGSAGRFGAYEAVIALLERVSAERPLLVAVDDLHWADPPSLQLFELLARRLSSLPVLLVGTYREEEAAKPGLAAVLATVTRYPWTRRVALSGLSFDAVAQLVGHAVGGEVSPGLVSVVFSRSDGNPFFARELVNLLSAEGAADGAGLYTGVPLGVRDVVRRRLAALPERTRELLGLAAVIGREFELPLLAEAAADDRATVAEAIEPALTARLLAPVVGRRGVYAFVHALVSETIVDGLPATRRARLHERVGRALLAQRGEDDDHAEAIADHLLQASEAVGPEMRLGPLERAGDVAYRRFAFERAEGLWEALLETIAELPAGSERDRRELETLLRLLPLILVYRGYTDARTQRLFVRTFTVAERVGEVVGLVQMLAFASLAAGHRDEREEAQRLALKALRVARAADDPLALAYANHQAAMQSFWVGKIRAARRRFRAAIAAWEKVADEHPPDEFDNFALNPESLFYGRAAFIEAWAGDPDGLALPFLQHTLAAADGDRGPLARQISCYSACLVALAQRDYAACQDHCERGLDLPPEQQSSLYTLLLRIPLAWARAMQGDCEGRADEVTAAFTAFLATEADTFHRSQLCLRAEIELRCGQAEQALATLEPLVADLDDPEESYFLPWLLRLKGEALLAGAPDSEPARAEAIASFERAHSLARAHGSGTLAREADEQLQALARSANRV